MPTLSEVPGKFGWRQSPAIEGDSIWEERERIAKDFDLKEQHVFTGWNPEDKAQPPPGWLESQPKFPEFPSHVAVTYEYRPYRIFVIPHSETQEVVRHFRVGSHYEEEKSFLESVVEKVKEIEQIVPVTIADLSPAHVRLVFLNPATEEQTRNLQALFPYEQDGDSALGMEGYTSELELDSGPWFLAEWFFRDQEIVLWWD